MPSSDSSDSADERMPKKSQQQSVHVIKSKKQEKRIHCSRLIRNKWFIVGVAVLIFLIILAIILGVISITPMPFRIAQFIYLTLSFLNNSIAR